MGMILEDDPCDIIAKAMKCQELKISDLAHKTKLSESNIRSVLDGEINVTSITSLCIHLGLSAGALLDMGVYRSEVGLPDGVYKFTSKYGYLGVNSYLVTYGEIAILFDTGTDAQPVVDFVNKHQLRIIRLYITHRHADHIACLDRFEDVVVTYPEELGHEESAQVESGLKVVSLDVSGHASHAMAYLITGLSAPVCICGDSLFAGSMGKAPNKERYQQALQTASENILSLSPQTIICPGHGPLTTVDFERRHNPFFASL